jgi:cation diffusion facilitator family transporter
MDARPSGRDPAGRGAEQGAGREGDESLGTVLLAMGANAVIALAKGVAALLSGSAAMAAETAHSIADTMNEVFLLIALRRSSKPPDRKHPLGYGPERFFWSLVAAVSIFVSGAVFSAVEGIRALLGPGSEVEAPVVSYVVLGVSFVAEGTSLVKAARQVKGEVRHERQTLRKWLRTTDDPTVKTVFYEDSAALAGLVLAALGIALHQITGLAVFDGIASLLIAALLTVVAYFLARTNKDLLVASQADPRLVHAIARWLADRPELDAVVDLLTVRMGTDQVLVCARVDFDNRLDAAQVERSSVEMDAELRERFTEVFEVFIEAVPRQDEALRERVRERYGARVASLLTSGESARRSLPARQPQVPSGRVRTPEDQA